MNGRTKILIASAAVLVTIGGLALYAVSVVEPMYLSADYWKSESQPATNVPPQPNQIEPMWGTEARSRPTKTAAEFAKSLGPESGFKLEAVNICGRLWCQFTVGGEPRPFSLIAHIVDVADSRSLYEIDVPRSSRGLHDFPPQFCWQEYVGPVPTAVRVIATIRDEAGSMAAMAPIEIVAARNVPVRETVMPNRSAELDALVAGGIYEIQFAGESRTLYLNIPGEGLSWPAAFGFGAIVDGLDKDGTKVFSVRVAKAPGVDVYEELHLTSRLSTAACDSVTHLRITSDSCLATVTMPTNNAWAGTMTVPLQPMHIPVRRSKGARSSDDAPFGTQDIDQKWIFPAAK